MKYFRNAIAVMLILLLALPAGALAATATVNSNSAKAYRSKSTSSASVALSKGVSLTVKSVSGSWAKVSHKGVTAYVPTKYLSSTSTASAKSSSRTAAYINKKTYVYKSASASSRKVAIDVNTKIYVVGQSGKYYKVQKNGSSATGYVLKSCVSKSKTSTETASVAATTAESAEETTAETVAATSGDSVWKSSVVKMEWFNGGSRVLKTGNYGYMYDIDTGITVHIKRMGGHNHADVEPASAADTAKLKKVAGGTFSWNSHAVILIAGGKYVACGINTLPHGDQTIRNNNYNGQFCLHMVGSLCHGSGKVNANHQASIQRAYDWAHGK